MKNIINSITDEIQRLQTIDDIKQLNNEDADSLARLNFCFEILARSEFAKNMAFIPDDDMCYRMDIRPGDSVNAYPISCNYIADFIDKFVIGDKNIINIIEIVKLFINHSKKSQKEIAINCNIREASISDFLTGKKNMRANNIEKIINFCLK